MGPGTLSQPSVSERRLILPGVVVALEKEAGSLVKTSPWHRKRVKPPEGFLFEVSGMGAESACRASESLIEKGAHALISWGCAGGLHYHVSPGDLVLPKAILFPDHAAMSVDTAWHERLFNRLRASLEIHTASLIQMPSVLTGASEKLRLYEKYGAVAVDMESGAVAAAAMRAQIPFVAIRAICDPVDMLMPHVPILKPCTKRGYLSLYIIWKLITSRVVVKKTESCF